MNNEEESKLKLKEKLEKLKQEANKKPFGGKYGLRGASKKVSATQGTQTLKQLMGY